MRKTVSVGLFLTLYSTVSTKVSPNYPQTSVPQSTPVRKPASTVGGFPAGGPSLLALLRNIIRGIISPAQANSVLSSRSARPPLASHLQSQANPSGPLPGDRLPPGGAAPISIANGPVPSLQSANPSMGGHHALHTAVNGKSGAGQPIRHPASHLPGTGGRQPLHIAVNGKSGVGQPIRHPASLLPGTGWSLQAGNIPQVPIGVQSGPITTQSQANPNGPLPADRLPPGGAAPISIANGPVPSLQYANPSMGGYQPLHTAVNGTSGAGQPIRHPASHLPGTGGRQPLHIAVNGKSGVGQPIRHPASLLPGTGGSLQEDKIPQVPIGVQSGPITTQSQANPNGPLPADRLPPGGAAPISIANGPVPSLQYANPSMGGYQPLHTAVNGKSGAGQPIRHPASHLPGTGGRQPLHIAVNGKSGVGQPIRHPASLLPRTGGSLQAGKITQLPIGVQSGPITTPGQPTRHPASGTGGSIQTGNIPAGSIGVHSGPITTPVRVPLHVLTLTMKTPLSVHLKPLFGEQPFIGLGSLHSGGSLPELPEPAEPNAGEHESVEPAIGKQIPAAILERMRKMHISPKLKPGVGVPPGSISPSLAPSTYSGPSTRSASTSSVAPTQPSLDALLSQLEGHRPVRKRPKASALPAGATTSPGGLVGGISRAVIDISTTTVVPLHVRPETSPTVHVSRISNSSEPPAITQSTHTTTRGWSATPNLQLNGPVYTQPSTTTAQSTTRTRTRTTATVQPSRSTIASIWDLIFGLPTSAPHYPLFDTTQSTYYSISGSSDCDCNRKDDSCPPGKIYAGECHDGIRCCDSW